MPNHRFMGAICTILAGSQTIGEFAKSSSCFVQAIRLRKAGFENDLLRDAAKEADESQYRGAVGKKEKVAQRTMAMRAHEKAQAEAEKKAQAEKKAEAEKNFGVRARAQEKLLASAEAKQRAELLERNKAPPRVPDRGDGSLASLISRARKMEAEEKLTAQKKRVAEKGLIARREGMILQRPANWPGHHSNTICLSCPSGECDSPNFRLTNISQGAGETSRQVEDDTIELDESDAGNVANLFVCKACGAQMATPEMAVAHGETCLPKSDKSSTPNEHVTGKRAFLNGLRSFFGVDRI